MEFPDGLAVKDLVLSLLWFGLEGYCYSLGSIPGLGTTVCCRMAKKKKKKIHFASLCLLIGVFNPFMFNVITEKVEFMLATLLFPI